MTSLLLLLVRLFPAPFRARFSEELREQIRVESDRARERGAFALAGYTLLTSLDLIRAGVAERIAPAWARPRASSQEDFDMRLALGEWVRDMKRATRTLRRTPGFAAVSVITLGLAIGATAGMFGVVNTVLLKPLPFPDSDRLVYIEATAPGSQLPERFGVSEEFLPMYTENSKLLEGASLFFGGTSTARVGERVERVRMGQVSTNLWSVLAMKPILGRLPVPEDESNVVLISYEMWQDWFGGDTAVLGQTHGFSYAQRQIIGVLPPRFDLPQDDTHFWIPFVTRADAITQPGRFGAAMVARVKAGVDPEALALELTTISKGLPARFGGSANYAKTIEQHRAVVEPLYDAILGGVRNPMYVLLGALSVVLLIACANVANLLLVRAEVRQREMAVRAAIGAGRGELVRVLLSESFVIAGLSGILALAIAWMAVPLLVAAAPTGIPRLTMVKMDWQTMAFTFIAAITAGVACGIIPALRASAPDLARLREAGRGATGGRNWLRNGLVVGQTALALVLLIGSGLLMRSYAKLNGVDAGYRVADIFTFQIAPEQPALTDGPSWSRFSHDFMDRMRALPGVETVGLVENVPLDEGTGQLRYRTESQAGDAEGGTRIFRTFAAGDYFKAMDIKVLAGRGFTRDDDLVTHGNIVISRSAAKLLWGEQDAIGRRIQQDGQTDWFTVVGVVEDVMQLDWREPGQALVYYPMVGPTPTSWRLGSPAYVVRTTRAATIAPEVRAIAKQIAPEAPMYRVYTMDQLARRSMSQLSFTMLTLGIAAALALILGAVGLYGVLSYIVAQRTREIGVRMALGADATQVRRMVVGQGAKVVAAGVVIGGVAAIGITRALSSLLYGVTALDIPTFAAMSGVMVAIGLLACYLPARRASSVDPLEAIRGD